MAAVNRMPITVDDGKPELGRVISAVLEHDSISLTPAVDGSGVENGGEVVGKVENTENKTKGLADVEGGITEVVSGGGESLGGEKGRLLQGESDHVEGGDVGVLAEVATLVESTGKAISPESASQNSKTMSPSKVGDIGGSHNAPNVQVSPLHNIGMSLIAPHYNPIRSGSQRFNIWILLVCVSGCRDGIAGKGCENRG